MSNEVESILDAYADVLDQQTSDDFIRESLSFGTVASGTYIATVKAKELRTAYKAFNGGYPKPERFRVHAQFALVDPVTGKKGTTFADLSPIERRNAGGRLDTAAQLWGHLAKAHDAGKRGLKNRQIIEEFGSFPYKLKVRELFEVDGGLKSADTPDEAKMYRNKGYRSLNLVNSLSLVE